VDDITPDPEGQDRRTGQEHVPRLEYGKLGIAAGGAGGLLAALAAFALIALRVL
jgi:hypothetical protein